MARRKTAPGSTPATFIAPQLATLVATPPSGEGWLHEIKFDGYRLLAVLQKPAVRLFTRAGNDWTDKFAALGAAFAKLKVDNAVIDGEVVNASAEGSASFHALQEALSEGNLKRLRYYAFDLLHLNGVDLRQQPQTERKAALEKVLKGAPTVLVYSQHFTEPGDRMLAHACSLGLEGIVSKHAQAPYRSGRTGSWLKSKCLKEQEFVVGGFTEQPKHPGMLGALLIGYYEGDVLTYAGKVGTGFSAREGSALLMKLKTLERKTTSFAAVPTDARRGARFVEPRLVVHVNFGEWTPDGRLRHPSFQGLREDKPAREVVREQPKSLKAIAAPANATRSDGT
ncbi:MAG TPA: non-homologous end-joining DNA ligase [Steroidobacteraceae bacterium]|nr:non-homologous end-joining DNA ligase [Steroidobacteraceae bacterium]